MKDSPLTLTIPIDRSKVPASEGVAGNLYEASEGYVYLCVRVDGEVRPMYVCVSAMSLYKPVPLEGRRLRDLGRLAVVSEEE